MSTALLVATDVAARGLDVDDARGLDVDDAKVFIYYIHGIGKALCFSLNFNDDHTWIQFLSIYADYTSCSHTDFLDLTS